MAIATTRTLPYFGDDRAEKMRSIFEPILKPDMRINFFKNWDRWFVLTNQVKDLRQPGLLKSRYSNDILPTYFCISDEFEFSRGQFIALGCKSYFAYNAESNENKRGSKVVIISNLKFFKIIQGIPHRIPLELKNFREVLYGVCDDHNVQLSTLRLDKNRKMSRFTQHKQGLSDLYVKHQVLPDKISCTPISLNGKFL